MASETREETPGEPRSEPTSPETSGDAPEAASARAKRDTAPRDAADQGTPPRRSAARERVPSRARRITARAALIVGVLATAMGISLIGGCFINDHTIGEAPGSGVAEVVDTSPIRTAVRFNTPDGQVYIPPGGVLYPSGLKTGQLIRVEYDMRNPDLVRVAGRDGTVSLLPVASALAVVWAVVLLVFVLARRPGGGPSNADPADLPDSAAPADSAGPVDRAA